MDQPTATVLTRTFRALTLVLALALLAVTGGAATATDNRVTTSQVELDRTVFVPCAGTSGENVHLTGTLIASVTEDDDGVVRLHYNPARVVGAGDTTGATYHGTGVSSSIVVTSGDGSTTRISIENFRLISEGPAPDLTFHLTLILRTAPDGSVTGTVDNVVTRCR